MEYLFDIQSQSYCLQIVELWPCRFKQELVVGNVSKWLEEEEREGMATHKWMLYVRGGKGNPDLSAVVSRVEVRLHSLQT